MSGKMYNLDLVQPGIQKDGTNFASASWTDGLWVRFQRSKPRKMGGYIDNVGGLDEIVRAMLGVPNSPGFNVYCGSANKLIYIPFDQFGNKSGPTVDRTPDFFMGNVNNTWIFDTMFSATDNGSIIVATAAPNLASIDSTTERAIYYGDALATSKLIPTGFSTSGGIVALHPYLLIYGNNGTVSITAANNPTTSGELIVEDARITGSKIVYGLPVRGGNSSPAALLWSLDSVIRVTNVGASTPEFKFDTVSAESSVLSSHSIIEYDGIYFWCGLDRFLLYNGTCQQLPNEQNQNFFFDNLNYNQRQKVWATKNTEFGEIWWFFVLGDDATECNHAIVYNVLMNKWYNTPIDRSAGINSQIYQFPFWSDSQAPFTVWTHEYGVDKINFDDSVDPIQSYFESADLSLCASMPDGSQPGIDKRIYLYRMEPDFIQSGDMTFTVNGSGYARGANVSTSFPFTDTQEKVDVREERRLMTLKFESNVVGGDYQMGRVLLDIRTGDVRP